MPLLSSSKTSGGGLAPITHLPVCRPLLHSLVGSLLGLFLGAQSQTTTAALNITPPQLAPDANGVIATEVRSTLSGPSRWSVRIIPWDPAEPDSAKSLAVNLTANANQPSSTLPLNLPINLPQISPRFFSLQPLQHQVIRARVHDRSKRYRLLIEQVADDQAKLEGVNFQFRFSLPIYQSRQDPAIPLGITIR